MPEGDTIHIAARNLRKVLDGRTIRTAEAYRRDWDASQLSGVKIRGIEVRGKHLMIHFENGQVLHSHMGMTGSWHIYRPVMEWQKPKSFAALALFTDDWVVVCFTPKLIELVSETTLRRNRYLQRLGPDLLGPPISDQVLLSRFRTQNAAAIGEAVMNQTVVSGIGNVYKSEILFVEKINPQSQVADLTDAQLLSLRDRAATLMRSNMDGHIRKTRFRGDNHRLWVYRRRGESCLTCGQEIKMIRQGDLGRSTYFCPGCQPG